MPQRRDRDALVDIASAALQIEEYVDQVTREALARDAMRTDAIIRRIEVIGEASKRLSAEFKSDHPAVPWRDIAGMRDLLIHAYDEVDLDEVWRVATADVPSLLEWLRPLLPAAFWEET